MRHVGADQLFRGQRHRHHQQRDDEAAAADRGQPDQKATERADGDQPRRGVGNEMVGNRFGAATDAQPDLAQHQRRGDDQHHPDEPLQGSIDRRGVHGMEQEQDGHRNERRRHAADGQRAHHAHVDSPLSPVLPGSREFGQRGIRQVGADGRGRRHAQSEHQQRRHQHSATHPGQPDERADNQAIDRQQPLRSPRPSPAGAIRPLRHGLPRQSTFPTKSIAFTGCHTGRREGNPIRVRMRGVMGDR